MAWLPVSTQEYLFIPVDGPPNVDLTKYAVDIALVTDDGSEPGSADWVSATWIQGRAALMFGATGAIYPPGMYMAWVRLHAGAELPVIRSGRVRVGDTRP